jgi:5'-nucleotidase
MNILITNDDGIEARGLAALAMRLERDHSVFVVAPDGERSACSHSINIKGELAFRKVGSRSFACEGSTVDCVLIALRGFIREEMDMVISGINLGPNLGTDIIYSGTAGGARQGALMGKPSVALSAWSREPDADYACQAEFVARNLDLLKKLWTRDHFININFPARLDSKTRIAVTFPSKRTYYDNVKTRTGEGDTLFVSVEGDEPGALHEPGSDFDAVKANAVSISPILIHPLLMPDWESYKNAAFIPVNGGCVK